METEKIHRLIIDISALRANVRELKKLINGKDFYAVIKADAYGMGAVEVMKSIDDIVDGYCVSSIEEALELRAAGTNREVLNLGYTALSEIETAAKVGVSIAVYDLAFAMKISDILKEKGLSIKAHIKLDTGHGRLGFRQSEKSLDEIEVISKLSSIEVIGVFSHLATADEEDVSHTLEQKEIFDNMLNKLLARGLKFSRIHLANDAGFIKHDFVYDLVRSGICLYGQYPSDLIKAEEEVELRSCFEWLTKVSFVKDLEEGGSVSYGRTFVADKNMRVATLAIGYADGYKRANSNKGYVLIRGKKAPIIGRVTMDQTMVDVSHIEGVEVGDDAILIGRSGDEYVSCDELASWADTINYEIMTSISKRVHRIYIESEA